MNTVESLVQQAIQASEYAYSPYSDYRVGAVLLAADGRVFTGCNIENASYPATICAERTALVKAVSEGVRNFTQLVVVTHNGGAPCGVCRQMLYEFAPDLEVIIADFSGKINVTTSLDALLPHGFGPSKLGK